MNNNRPDKIELVNCPHDCANFKIILFEINLLFHESEQYQIDKEYQFSIMSLKKAFEKTYELILPVEQQGAYLFRRTIIESLENIRQELKRMTKGFFRTSRYKGSLMMAEDCLKEFKRFLSADEESKIMEYFTLSKDPQINLPAV